MKRGTNLNTQYEQLIALFRRNNNRVTLGQIMQTTLAAEYRARMSELRREGYLITCTKGKTPSENLYHMVPPEPSGQMRML
jgi:hypothetical protein